VQENERNANEVKRHSKDHKLEHDDVLLQCEGFAGLMGVPFGIPSNVNHQP
jgi:hypothetical protein